MMKRLTTYLSMTMTFLFAAAMLLTAAGPAAASADLRGLFETDEEEPYGQFLGAVTAETEPDVFRRFVREVVER